MKKIYLVDVSSMFFRAFYAIRPLTSTKGVPVNAVYGFVSMIVKLLREKNPEYIVFCYDRKEPSFRKDLIDTYKANRTEMPDDMQVQMPYLKQVANLFGICDFEVPGFEADDLIGTIATLAKKENFETYIVSGDKDFSQLVDNKTFLYDTMKEVVFNPALVKEKHGVLPDQFIDYLAIVGDSSDNIAGVAGIGPKGAVKLLEEYKTLEGIYENVDAISSQSTKDKLLKSKDQAFLAKKLVTIVCDVPLAKAIPPLRSKDGSQFTEAFRRQPPKIEELRVFFHDLNFKTFEKNLLSDPHFIDAGSQKAAAAMATSSSLISVAKSPAAPSMADSGLVPAGSDQKSLPTFKNLQVNLKSFARQEIQNRLDAEKFFIFNRGSQLAIGFLQDLYVLDLAQAQQIDFTGLDWSGFDLKKIWHEIGVKKDFYLQSRNGKITTIHDDIMLTAYTLRAADSSSFEKMIKTFLQKETSQDTPLTEVYALLLELQEKLNHELEEKKLRTIYEKLERQLITILFHMEKHGIKIDIPFLKNFSSELEKEIHSLEKEIHDMAGESFNVASPKQLGVILFEKLGIEALKKTKTGYSTDSDVLEKIDHPIAAKVIQYRECAKLKSTYVDALPVLADAQDRVHTSFNQALTATGRLSSTNPNLQNIPIKTEIGKKVRDAFCSDQGLKLLSLDYSQIELRVLAHISNDPGLISAFMNDLDIHAATAAEVFSVDVKTVTSEQRRIAKAVNFGIAYGQGAFGLAETLGISRTESKEIIERYFKKFKGIKEYIDSTIEMAHEKKYVETLFGRRRYIPELDSSNVMIKKFGERAAINAPIQGTASDLVKMAMIDLARLLENSDLKMLLQVHDELIFEGSESAIETQLKQIEFKMENVARLKVPLKVNYAIGKNWGEAH